MEAVISVPDFRVGAPNYPSHPGLKETDVESVKLFTSAENCILMSEIQAFSHTAALPHQEEILLEYVRRVTA
jgi:hypothetical protein